MFMGNSSVTSPLDISLRLNTGSSLTIKDFSDIDKSEDARVSGSYTIDSTGALGIMSATTTESWGYVKYGQSEYSADVPARFYVSSKLKYTNHHIIALEDVDDSGDSSDYRGLAELQSKDVAAFTVRSDGQTSKYVVLNDPYTGKTSELTPGMISELTDSIPASALDDHLFKCVKSIGKAYAEHLQFTGGAIVDSLISKIVNTDKSANEKSAAANAGKRTIRDRIARAGGEPLLVRPDPAEFVVLEPARDKSYGKFQANRSNHVHNGYDIRFNGKDKKTGENLKRLLDISPTYKTLLGLFETAIDEDKSVKPLERYSSILSGMPYAAAPEDGFVSYGVSSTYGFAVTYTPATHVLNSGGRVVSVFAHCNPYSPLLIPTIAKKYLSHMKKNYKDVAKSMKLIKATKRYNKSMQNWLTKANKLKSGDTNFLAYRRWEGLWAMNDISSKGASLKKDDKFDINMLTMQGVYVLLVNYFGLFLVVDSAKTKLLRKQLAVLLNMVNVAKTFKSTVPIKKGEPMFLYGHSGTSNGRPNIGYDCHSHFVTIEMTRTTLLGVSNSIGVKDGKDRRGNVPSKVRRLCVGEGARKELTLDDARGLIHFGYSILLMNSQYMSAITMINAGFVDPVRYVYNYGAQLINVSAATGDDRGETDRGNNSVPLRPTIRNIKPYFN